VSFYTAQLTTQLTVQRIRGAIAGPSDLPGKRVGTLLDSTAETYLQANGAQVEAYKDGREMVAALLTGQVDALVLMGPVLRYLATHRGKGLVMTIGPEFNTEPVAIAFPAGSPLRREFDLELLKLMENGIFEQMRKKWFGTK
jgi:polar amino acid transport system substrate-binding protein